MGSGVFIQLLRDYRTGIFHDCARLPAFRNRSCHHFVVRRFIYRIFSLEFASGLHPIVCYSPHPPTPPLRIRGSNGRMLLMSTQTRSFLYISLFTLHNFSSFLSYSRITGSACGSVIHCILPRMFSLFVTNSVLTFRS
jgi:hypothetical protein